MVSRSYPIFLNENALNISGAPIVSQSILPPYYNFIFAFFIICGLFMLAKLFWMVWYEIKYGLGDEYLSGKLTHADKLKLRKEFKGWLKLIKKE
jgi:hypothetical protein